MIKIDEKDPAVKEFRAASAKLGELQREFSSIDREVHELESQLEALSQDRGQGGLILEAQAYLAGGEISTEAADRAATKESLAGLNRKRDVIEKAIILQQRVFDRAKGQYSVIVNAGVETAHTEIVLRMAKSYRALASACDEESRLFREIEEAGAMVRLRPMRSSRVGSLGDDYSAVNLFLKELKENFPEAYETFKNEKQ